MSATRAAHRPAALFAVLALLLASLVAGVVAASPAAADVTLTLRPTGPDSGTTAAGSRVTFVNSSGDQRTVTIQGQQGVSVPSGGRVTVTAPSRQGNYSISMSGGIVSSRSGTLRVTPLQPPPPPQQQAPAPAPLEPPPPPPPGPEQGAAPPPPQAPPPPPPAPAPPARPSVPSGPIGTGTGTPPLVDLGDLAAPLLPGTRAPEIAGGSSVDDVLSALSLGESRGTATQAQQGTNSRRDFGLPIALALLATVGVAAMLLRTLLTEPLPGQPSTVSQ